MNTILTGISPERLTVSPMHSHSVWEIVVYLRGTGVHTVGGREIRFEPGMIVCQPPVVPHGTVADADYQDMYLQVEGFVPPTGDEVPVLQDSEDGRFATLLRMLNEVFHKQERNWRPIADALTETLYQLLVSMAAEKPEIPKEVDAAIRRMVAGIADPEFDLAELADESGYCADHFRRCFKAATGMTPAKYMIALRMEHAKRLISDRSSGGMEIRQAALLSGYRDPYYFSRLFRRHTGMSPSEYAEDRRAKRHQ